jgi:SAM-dependent methyltransferase/uncharacterized protein YbaR (Trm112 family)
MRERTFKELKKVKQDLLQWLCCPECKSELNLCSNSSDGDVISEGTLTCSACARVYPIRRGIPRFVQTDGYVKSFSYEWNKWSRVQLDIARGFRESEETFGEKTGYLPQNLQGKLVLDAGCGSGRFLDVASRWGARVIGVDYSFAVEAAQTNVGERENVDVIQADIFKLPFKQCVFDAIFSIGVLHHTQDTRRAFLGLPPLLKEGGEIAVWLYYYPDSLYCKASDFWRAVFRYAPNRLLFAWCWLLVVLFSNLYRKPFMSRAPWGHLRRVLPVNTHPDFHWRVLDTFDWYSPRYQDKDNSAPRVARWFREAGLREIDILNFSTSMRGRKTNDQSIPLFRHPMTDLHAQRIVLFGAGAGGHQAFDVLGSLDLTDRVVAVCDNNPAKSKADFHGHPVRKFEELDRRDYDVVVIASLPGFKAISSQLQHAGLVHKHDFASMDCVRDYTLSFEEALKA